MFLFTSREDCDFIVSCKEVLFNQFNLLINYICLHVSRVSRGFFSQMFWSHADSTDFTESTCSARACRSGHSAFSPLAGGVPTQGAEGGMNMLHGSRVSFYNQLISQIIRFYYV